jgi:hypothetical protein
MNRRKLVTSTLSLVPGVALFRGHDLESGPSEVMADYPSVDCAALRASRNTEEVVMELLQQCLERIGWQGNASDWQTRLDLTLDRIRSWLTSKSDPLPVLITGLQMDCLRELCRAASTGNEPQTLLSALLLCDAFLPFAHWVKEGFLIGKDDKLTELARRHHKIHVLLGASTARIPLQELKRHLKAWELGNRGEIIKADVGNTDRFRTYLKHRDTHFREWIGLFSSKASNPANRATYHQQI